MVDKPNCHKCTHRGEVPGSAHSSCKHPEAVKARGNSPLSEAMAIFASVGRVAPVIAPPENIVVVGNQRGIRMGWFNWPYNFDQVWLEECSGLEAKTEKANA